ncbi:TetR/AcrR family transcriptional regulator [Neisseria leonii]|uniref:TetR/AcrR family transcriptional regulator n=1 Tax=Neisseria leonii TaxID=2995413 RepID=A0A9X4E3M8_9NEIS|nr:TetR/AcrR family transcriptional regulator [Neisseria sp. 51.81]MDD9328619.1 TetR/AcrR family transcriptional regulator [Neisseria sp. 51.81]
MAKETRPNTYARIVEASLVLFNEEGERNISTNHIAAHLGISPGNLYYHFRNKDEIILQLHQQYSSRMMAWIRGAELPKSIDMVVEHLTGVFDIMWDYRFLFSDMNSLLSRSAELLGDHNEFTRAKASPRVLHYLETLVEQGLLQASREDLQSLALNLWIITKYWFDFHGSVRGRDKLGAESKQLGVLRDLSLLRPYVAAEHREALEAAAARLMPVRS